MPVLKPAGVSFAMSFPTLLLVGGGITGSGAALAGRPATTPDGSPRTGSNGPGTGFTGKAVEFAAAADDAVSGMPGIPATAIAVHCRARSLPALRQAAVP